MRASVIQRLIVLTIQDRCYPKTLYSGKVLRRPDSIHWGLLCRTVEMPEDFIRRHNNYVNWISIMDAQKLRESFIESNIPGLISLNVWHELSRHQVLSEDFIERYPDHVDWHAISENQVLSEEFIHKHRDLVWWFSISAH